VLSTAKQSVLFYMLCAITVACVAFEGYLIYAMIATGFTAGKTVAGVANGGIMFASGKIFLQLLKNTLLKPEKDISFGKLHRFASDRCRALNEIRQANLDDFVSRQRLLTEALAFAEESLRGWLPGSHFELCVFVDQDQPLLFAYFDSNGNHSARSMIDREKDHNWYVKKKYEVVKVLTNPSSHLFIINDTEREDYSFTSKQQRKQLKSTMLWCFDLENPCAIVISSNSKEAFKTTDPEVESFVKFIGTLVRFDLLDHGFLPRIRDFKPSLFSA